MKNFRTIIKKLLLIKCLIVLTGGFVFSQTNEEKNNDSITNINDGWIEKAVVKFQMLDPSTKTWEEIVFFEPDQNIKIRNEKDVLIDDVQIVSYIAGRDVAGFYKAVLFTNARQENTTTKSAKRYVGNIELLNNNNIPSEKAETAIYFFYDNNNKLGCIEIQSYMCRCKARIFIDDFKEGLDFIDD